MKTHALKKIIGSLFVIGFEGETLTDSVKDFLEEWDLGGVILFKRNIRSIEQVIDLNKSIYNNSKKTPIVSVDHEGGRVFRLPEPFTVFPPMRQVVERGSADGDPRVALRDTAQVFARELRAVGFNLDYAPVLDVDSNRLNPIIGDRAFSSNPEEVAELGIVFFQTLMEAGIQPCGKHFPGHGDTAQDSHLTLPVVDKSAYQLAACEWIPFRRAIDAGLPMLMTAHVLYPSLDPDWPATLSEKILTGLLRDKWNYQGLVISDDFFMRGIAEKWSIEGAVERFLRVGGDLVLLCHQESVQRQVALHLLHLAEQNGDFLALLEQKSKRVNQYRHRLPFGIGGSMDIVGCADHRRIAAKFE